MALWVITAYSSPVLASIVDDYVLAETTADKNKSIKLWNELLQKNISELVKQGLTKDIIRKNIVNDYVSLYLKEKDIIHLENALEFIRLNIKDLNQGWSKLYILNAVKGDDSLNDFKIELINDIEISANDSKHDSNLFYGLSLILTSMNNDELLSRVHRFLMHLNNDDHRIHILRNYAIKSKENPLHPSMYNVLYNALSNKQYPTPKSLIEIHDDALDSDNFDLALLSILSIKNDKQRTNALKNFFYKMNDLKYESRMRRIIQKVQDPSLAVNLWSHLAEIYALNHYNLKSDTAYKNAFGYAGLIKTEKSRKKAYDLIKTRKKNTKNKRTKTPNKISLNDRRKRNSALTAVNNNDIAKAVYIVKKINDPIYRTLTFRMIAQRQMVELDRYNILKDNLDNTYILTGVDNIDFSPDELTKLEEKITNSMNNNPLGLTIKKGNSSHLGKIISTDNLSDKLIYNSDMIRDLIPLPNHADIKISYYENNILNEKFVEIFGNIEFVKQQKTSAPITIIIENGITDIPAIYDALKSKGYKNYMKREGNTYTLYRPLIINNNATLNMTGIILRLAQKSGAYIVNAGTLYTSDMTLSGWDEQANKLAYATYKDRKKFRPFLTAWSRSKTYIGASQLNALGYGNGKSYGLSFSSGPSQWIKHGNQDNVHRPTGIIADNSIYNAMYGYYSYEASDFIINGNEYHDNIIYGIDPHDRSQRLVIGYNTAYNTQNKHGIIISREVNDSLIAGNLSFDNTGTGIMIDRDSNGNLLYGNTSFHNNNDGITFFESDCSIVAANKIFENGGSGIRLRNSHNLGVFYNNISYNKQNGLKAYIKSLTDDPAHKYRDFNMDPYDELTTMTVVGNIIRSNEIGVNIEPITAAFLKGNKFINQSPKILHGPWFEHDADILFRYDQDNNGIIMHRTCPPLGKKLIAKICKYRDNKTLNFDGQNNLIKRIEKSACAQSVDYIKNREF